MYVSSLVHPCSNKDFFPPFSTMHITPLIGIYERFPFAPPDSIHCLR